MGKKKKLERRREKISRRLRQLREEPWANHGRIVELEGRLSVLSSYQVFWQEKKKKKA